MGKHGTVLHCARLIRVYNIIRNGPQGKIWIQRDFNNYFNFAGAVKGYLICLEKLGLIERTPYRVKLANGRLARRDGPAWRFVR